MMSLTIDPLAPGVYNLSGVINEYTDLTPLLKKPGSSLILNLKGISYINSLGVTRWLGMLRDLEVEGKSVEYQECSQPFLLQCSMVLTLTQGVKLSSGYVSHYCEDCAESFMQLVQFEKVNLSEIPSFPCPSCGKDTPMEDEDQLDFLKG